MGFFKSLKGEGPERVGGEEGSRDQQQRSAEKRRLFGHSSPDGDGSVRDGLPPQMKSTEYDPPPGPPPSQRIKERETFAPPPGPPPSQRIKETETFAPPPHPPPRQANTVEENPPPYHDWTVIPDTALLPPPPALHYDHSTNNASWDDAASAHAWCRQNPVYSPTKPNATLYAAVQGGDHSLQKPPQFTGDLAQWGKGQWKVKTKSRCTDCILLSTLPQYFAAEDSPFITGRSKTVYFEIRLLAMGESRGREEEAGVAVGFCARPYPCWRLPGWQRASLGVHGDDGRRFVNDPDGGIDFTAPFKPGETIGVGMMFSNPASGHGHDVVRAEVFFTRDGKRDKGWEVSEERDQQRESVLGLQGELDLYAAIGMFGAVEFEVQLAPEGWLYQP